MKPLALGFVIGTVGSGLVWIWAMTAEEGEEDYEP